MNEKKIISRDEAALIFRVSPQTLDRWRYQGEGPNYIQVGRRVSYYEEDVKKYFREVCEVKAYEKVSPAFSKSEETPKNTEEEVGMLKSSSTGFNEDFDEFDDDKMDSLETAQEGSYDSDPEKHDNDDALIDLIS